MCSCSNCCRFFLLPTDQNIELRQEIVALKLRLESDAQTEGVPNRAEGMESIIMAWTGILLFQSLPRIQDIRSGKSVLTDVCGAGCFPCLCSQNWLLTIFVSTMALLLLRLICSFAANSLSILLLYDATIRVWLSSPLLLFVSFW